MEGSEHSPEDESVLAEIKLELAGQEEPLSPNSGRVGAVVVGLQWVCRTGVNQVLGCLPGLDPSHLCYDSLVTLQWVSRL